MDWKCTYKNFLIILVTVHQFVSILFVFTPAAVLISCTQLPVVKLWLEVPSVIEGWASDRFLATHHKKKSVM